MAIGSNSKLSCLSNSPAAPDKAEIIAPACCQGSDNMINLSHIAALANHIDAQLLTNFSAM
ncbi:MAG: hypothetical protein OFPI_34930 [Osedax symbiont Rs2]|nr:MAG: hypothetical protein OFPI_34930 [Osedax symbiont Rs2]